ncbi:hypothetical protein HDU93_000419, partial [Gonapodya sp. JEL0774]
MAVDSPIQSRVPAVPGVPADHTRDSGSLPPVASAPVGPPSVPPALPHPSTLTEVSLRLLPSSAVAPVDAVAANSALWNILIRNGAKFAPNASVDPHPNTRSLNGSTPPDRLFACLYLRHPSSPATSPPSYRTALAALTPSSSSVPASSTSTPTDRTSTTKPVLSPAQLGRVVVYVCRHDEDDDRADIGAAGAGTGGVSSTVPPRLSIPSAFLSSLGVPPWSIFPSLSISPPDDGSSIRALATNRDQDQVQAWIEPTAFIVLDEVVVEVGGEAWAVVGGEE